MNDLWKVVWREECPPRYYFVNNTCTELIHCSGDNADCKLTCGSAGETSCVLEGSLVIDGSVTDEITLEGDITVTENVYLVGDVKLVFSKGAKLNVGKCLVLEGNSGLAVQVDSSDSQFDTTVLATYDGVCSSTVIESRTDIRTTLDECGEVYPTVQQHSSGGRAQLTLLFVFNADGDDACNGKGGRGESGSNVNVAAAVVVPIVVLIVLAVAVVLLVPKLREKVLFCAK